MMLRNSGVRRRSSSLALLGVSAVVLAAACETPRDAHASAFAGGGTTPGIARTAMRASESAAIGEAAVSVGSAGRGSKVADPPIPRSAVKPFVLVRLPYDPSIYPDGGEVLGVSNHGEDLEAIAVGYLRDDPAAAPQPFMFTASTNTVTMLDMDDGAYDYGAATCISPNGQSIAGWAYHTSSSKMRAVVWEAPNYQIDATLSPSTDSYWNAINDSGVPAGAYWVSDHYESVVGTQTPAYPYAGKEGEAKGINANGVVSGWYIHTSGYSHAYRWDSPTVYMDIHPTDQAYQQRDSGANCINNSLNIGGWLTNQYGSHIATHWRPLSLPGWYQTKILGDGDSSSYEVVAINSGSAMLINRIDSVPGIVLWIHNSEANEAVVIDGEPGSFATPQLILMPNPDDHIWNGHCLNDDLWIGGSYLIHGDGLPRPCLAIPYDVDNSGVADFREIVESGMSGSFSHHNENYGLTWLLDVAENVHPNGDGMRIGLNAPGYAEGEETHDIEHTQIVRLPLGIHNPDFASAGPEEFYANGILHSGQGSQCAAFQTGVNSWAQIPQQNLGREIVLMLRSNLDDSDPDDDYLPTAPNVDLGEGITKADVLANLHRFSYNFSRCVDWIQLGNEAFSSADQSSFYGGHGGYKIWAEEVGDCWTTGNDPREFEEITCPIPAIEAVQAWHYEQMWAILEGSALAGRPLRIVGPAVPLDTIYNFVSEDTTTGWKVIDRTAKWCNDYQVWFDMHARYLAPADVETARYYLRDNPGNPTWQYPFHAVCLEWAPKLDIEIDWWTENNGLNALRFDKFLNMPDCNDDPGITWETYIAGQTLGWKHAQFSDDFGMANAAYYLWYDGFTVICYGSTLQSPVSDPLYDLAALRAQNVCDQYIQTQYKFTELKTHYQNAADDYEIQDFDPHEDACSACGEN